jgi:CheY-like chemotaxis protein
MGTPLCVLIVDDSKFFIELEKQFLRNTPATVLTADSARKALLLAREHRPSLVYMDVDMPEINGFDCCRAFKSDPVLREIPVVLIGGDDPATDEAKARNSGAEDYLPKPLDRRLFLVSGHRFLVSIDRREPRRNCQIIVDYTCRGRRLMGRCIDVSSGGMFLESQTTAQFGESLLLKFCLPDEKKTQVEVQGRIAWANAKGTIIKEGFPLGYGVEFVDIADSVGTALRRCFGT